VTTLAFNAAYAGRTDGTGAWTDCLLSLGLDWKPLRVTFDPTQANRWSFYRKLIYEAAFQRETADLRIHPYAACAFDRKAAIVVLDAIGAGGGHDWHAKLVRHSIRRADRLATLSEHQRARLEALHDRAFAVLTPFPEASFFESPSRVEASGIARPESGRMRIGYWGGWHPRKGMRDVLRTVPQGSAGEFVVTGDAPRDVSARPDVTALGRLDRSSLIAVIDTCDVAVYPSRDEGFGLPPYEALLRGLPVVVRDLPCYREFIVDNPGCVFRFDDDDQFAEALQAALGCARTISDASTTRGDLRTPTLTAAKHTLVDQLAAWLRA
jgi:glycosyltransferase involved in cell wall biosynthesis